MCSHMETPCGLCTTLINNLVAANLRRKKLKCAKGKIKVAQLSTVP